MWYVISHKFQQNVITVVLSSNQLVNDLRICSLFLFGTAISENHLPNEHLCLKSVSQGLHLMGTGLPILLQNFPYKPVPSLTSPPTVFPWHIPFPLLSSNTPGLFSPRSLFTCCSFCYNALSSFVAFLVSPRLPTAATTTLSHIYCLPNQLYFLHNP